MLIIDGTKMASMIFLNFLNQYISNLSNIYNPSVNISLASQMKCDKMFSDPKSDHIFSHFSVTFLVYIFFFSYVVIHHLFRIRGGVGIYCKLINYWIESTQAQILFPSQCRSGIQNQIRITNWRSISIYLGVITLTLFRFFDCDCILSL